MFKISRIVLHFETQRVKLALDFYGRPSEAALLIGNIEPS